MSEIQNYTSFIAAILIFQLTPGAGTIAILNATARGGIRGGMGAVFGTLLGDFIFMSAALAGLAAIMNANPLLFKGVQWFGAAYLCWIGIRLFRRQISDPTDADVPSQSMWRCFTQACAISMTNPKVILFFVSFFPLFLRADASAITLAVMMAHVTVISFLYQAMLVLFGNAVAERLRSFPSARRITTRLAGIALLAFGIKLAAGNR